MEFLVIGYGSIGKRHAWVLRGLGHGVTTLDPAPDMEADVRSPKGLGNAGFDGVLDCTYPDDRQVTKGGYRTRAYFVEKPLGTGITQCDRPMMLGFCYYWLPSLRDFVGSLRGSRVCGLMVHSGQALQSFHPTVDYRQRYHGTPGRGGVLNDVTSHLLFIARWVLGDLRLVGSVASKLSALKIQTEDVAVLLLVSPQGQPCTIWADYMREPRETAITALTGSGTRTWRANMAEFPRMYESQMQAFCEVCDGTRGYGYPDLADGLAVQQILEAARPGCGAGPHGILPASRQDTG